MKREKFIFVCPIFNASKTLARCLHSIACQSYTNWKIILIDDCSSKEEADKEDDIIAGFHRLLTLPEEEIKIITVWNEDIDRGKCYETSNVLYGIKNFCSDEDIVCRIDGDDALCDSDALLALDISYQRGYDCVWTAHRWTGSCRNISGSLTDKNPYKSEWRSSHLKTFRKKLINDVPYENFTNMNGELVRRAGDRALYLPVLHKAKCSGYLPMVTYSYTIDEQGGEVYHTEDARFQKEEANFLAKRGFVSEGARWEDVIK